MIVARQSTARTVTVGPVLDSSGAAVTTAVVGDFKLSKNGGAPAALNGSATLTHRNTGHYSLALTASDTDTVGQAEVVIDATTNACPVKEITVVEEAVYDALFAASAGGYLQPTTAGRTLDVTAGGCAGIDWANVEAPTTALNLSGTNIDTDQVVASVTGAVGSVTGAVGSVTGAVGSVTGNVGGNVTGSVGSVSGVTFPANFGSLGINASGHVSRVVLCDTLTTYTSNTPQTGDSYARLGAPAGASVSADVAAVKADTAAALADTNELQTDWANGGRLDLIVDDILADTAVIGAAGAGLTAVPWNAAWDAEVQSEVEDALVVHRLDELLNADSDIDGAAPPTVGSVFHELMTKTAGSFTYDQTTDSLEALRDRGDAAWVTATGFSTHSAADVWAVATRVLTAATNISGPIADAVWLEPIADHSGTAGSTAEALGAAGAAGDPWTTALPGAYGAGSAGNILGNRLVGTIATGTHNPQSGDSYAIVNSGTHGNAAIKTQAAAIEADTQDIQSRLPAALSGGNMPSVLADGVAHGGSTATLTLGSTGQSALYISSTGSGVSAAQIINTDSGGIGAVVRGGSSGGGIGLQCRGSVPIEGSITGNITGNLSGSTGDSADIDAIKAKTDNLPTDPADQSAVEAAITAAASGLATAANLATVAGYLDTEVAAIKAKTDNLPAAPAATGDCITAAGVRAAVGLASASLDTQLGDLPTNAELATAITTALTTALAEGYRATGATGSVRDLLYEILANITEFSISGVTKTAKKLDGSTTAKTYTLDSSTAPTSITETT